MRRTERTPILTAVAALLFITIISAPFTPLQEQIEYDEKTSARVSPERTSGKKEGGTRGNINMLVYQGDARNSCGGNGYVTLPKNFLKSNGIKLDEKCSGTLNAAVLKNYDVVYLGRSRSRGRVVEKDVRDWVKKGGGIWSESNGMVDQQDPVAGGWVSMEDMFGYTNRIGRGDNAGGFSFTKVVEHEIWRGVNSPVNGGNGLYDSQLRDHNIANHAVRIGDANNHQSPVVTNYGRGRTYSGVGGNWNSNANAKQYFLNVVQWLAVGVTAHAENAALIGEGNGEKICYSRLRPYTISVTVRSKRNLNAVSDLKLHLDYNTTNVTLGYNWTNKVFYKSKDPDGHVRLLVENSSADTDGKEKWWLNFTMYFNFSFPHERLIDSFVNTTVGSGDFRLDRFPWLFRVENDLEFEGTPEVSGEYQGELEEGDWVRGGEGLTVRNLTVHYEGAPHIVPDDKYFDVRIEDTNGEKWWDNGSAGEEVIVNITARNDSVPDEEYRITIVNIPGDGYCATNFSFPVKIDAHAPLAPADVRCVINDKEVKYVNTPSVNITWDAIIDNGSGLLGYFYSGYDSQGTDNGTFTEETEGEITELNEGTREVFVWAVDNVGNIGSSANSSILIDLTAPTFRGFLPTDGSWHNHTKIECSVDILDTDGSGVDPGSVSYAVSTEGPYTFGPWVPVWVPEGGGRVRAEVKNSFNEGEENYFKWRAKDLSGNGFAESSPVNLKIDITPLAFSEEVSPKPGWYKEHSITSTIFLYDHGSGVDKESLKARVSTSGENEFGPWMEVREENVTEKDDGFELTFAFTYAEGDDNFLMFRGTDNVANPFSYSRHFNYKIDSTPVYFSNFDPPTDDFSDEKEVECLIDIYDDGIGVEPKSVEYSVSANGKEDFGPWKRAYDVSVGNPTTVRVETEFDWGRDNFIRFRADDKMANGVNTSEAFRVWVNSEPDVVISFPPNDGVYTAADVILFDASNSTDLDGDILSYYWTSNVKENATLGSKKKMRLRLAEGNHTIILHVDDGHEYNVSETVRVNVAGEEERDGKGTGGEGTEQIGMSGEGDGDLWIWVLIGLAVVLLLIISAILLIIRNQRGSEKEGATPSPSAPFASPNPYPQGQYFPDTVQTYQTSTGVGRPGQYGGYGREPRTSSPGLPGVGGMAQFPGARSSTLRPRLPPGQPTGMGPGMTGLPAQTGQGTGLAQQQLPATAGEVPPAAQTQYSLPTFDTGQGQQVLNRPALPPAPEGSEAQTPAERTEIGVNSGGESPREGPVDERSEAPAPETPGPPECITPQTLPAAEIEGTAAPPPSTVAPPTNTSGKVGGISAPSGEEVAAPPMTSPGQHPPAAPGDIRLDSVFGALDRMSD